MKYIVLATSIIVFVAFGCQKQQLPHYTINPALMKAWGFKTGTYWIYQDSLSGEVDSFVVESTQTKTNLGTSISEDEYDINIGTYKSDSFNIYYRMALSDSGLVFNNDDYATEMEPNLQYGVFMYPIYVGQSYIVTVNDSTFVSDIFSSLSINNNMYKNVAQIHHYSSIDRDLNYGGVMKHDDWFYACDNVGFVKMVFNHPEDSLYRNWELLRYHIEK